MIKPGETCKVVGLTYKISHGSSSDTLACVRLRLMDPNSLLCGAEFEVDIPPSHCGQAEFVISSSRFRAGHGFHFGVGDRCKARPSLHLAGYDNTQSRV